MILSEAEGLQLETTACRYLVRSGGLALAPEQGNHTVKNAVADLVFAQEG